MNAPNQKLVERVAQAIRSASNGLDGDPIGGLLDETPLIDATTTTRNEADEKINCVCHSAAQAALAACHTEELADALRKLIPWARETLNDREERLERDDDPINREMMERCSVEIEEAEALLAKVEGV